MKFLNEDINTLFFSNEELDKKKRTLNESKDASGLDITGAFPLSVEEARKLPLELRKYSNWWWLVSPGRSYSHAAYVDSDGAVNPIGTLVDISDVAVRPALQIKNLKSSNLNIGDVFKFGGKQFEIISNNLAFCLTDIGTHGFREDWEAEDDANDYGESDIKEIIDDWFDRTVSGPDLTEINGVVGDNKPDEDGLLIYDGRKVPKGYKDKVKKVIVKDGVTSIVKGAFSRCDNLTEIEIPSSVTRICDTAFSGCTSLTDITIPSSVTSIGKWAFYRCFSLTSVRFAEGSQCASIGDGAFYECSGLTRIQIPSSVTRIVDHTFSLCSSLAIIDIPSSVTSIEYCAFYDCTSLTSITIPSSVTRIGGEAFKGCRKLTTITIPSSVTDIGFWAFGVCENLTIHCKKGSNADEYAQEHDIPVKYI